MTPLPESGLGADRSGRSHDAPRLPDAAPADDPRIVAFGAGPAVPDPPVLHTLARYGVPVLAAVFGLLVGVVAARSADRPSSPVAVVDQGLLATSAAPAQVAAAATRTITVAPGAAAVVGGAVQPPAATHLVTVTAVRVTTAPPPAVPTLTTTATVTETITQFGLPGRRSPLVP